MNIATIALKTVLLVTTALAAFWAASMMMGGVDAPLAAESDCAAAKLRSCFFTIV